jgi:hypothetical protein
MTTDPTMLNLFIKEIKELKTKYPLVKKLDMDSSEFLRLLRILNIDPITTLVDDCNAQITFLDIVFKARIVFTN